MGCFCSRSVLNSILSLVLGPKMVSFFFYLFYYMRGTDVVALIPEGSRRKNFRVMHACSLAQHLATCGFSMSIESGYGKCINASKFLWLSTDFAIFWSYIQKLDSDNLSLSEWSQSIPTKCRPSWPRLHIL